MFYFYFFFLNLFLNSDFCSDKTIVCAVYHITVILDKLVLVIYIYIYIYMVYLLNLKLMCVFIVFKF